MINAQKEWGVYPHTPWKLSKFYLLLPTVHPVACSGKPNLSERQSHLCRCLALRTRGSSSILSPVADLGWLLGFHGTPLWAGSTTKKVLLIGLMEPPFQAKELRKLLLWLTLAYLRNNLSQKWIDWQGGARSFSLKRSKTGMVLTKLWVWPQNFRTHYWNGIPLHEILYPPLHPYYPP